MVAEDLLDILEGEVPGIFTRAYADDTALVLSDFWEAAPHLMRTFEDWHKVSGLHLNLSKSIIVPLNSATFTSFQTRLRREAPGWGDMAVKDSCKYLGFYVGPGKKDSSWTQPIKKFRERVNMWKDQPLGLFWDARIFNTFALPILTYVAQLEAPPPWVLQEVSNAFSKVAKGPNDWAIPLDLWTLKEAFGLQASFKNLEWTAIAAKVRVATFDAACLPRSRLLEDMAKIRAALIMPAEGIDNSAWGEWYTNSFTNNLQRALDVATKLSGSVEKIRQNRCVNQKPIEDDKLWRKQCQSATYSLLLSAALGDPRQRHRAKMARWSLDSRSSIARLNTAAWRSNRAFWVLKLVGKYTPPRPKLPGLCIGRHWGGSLMDH